MKGASIKVGFQTGEVSPLFESRVDHQRYLGSCRELTNFWPVPEGAVYRRSGTQFIGEAKQTGYAPILVPFVFSPDQAYVLEFGHNYIRFYTTSGRVEVSGTPVEVTTTYTASQLKSLRFAQSADVIYIVHPDHPPRRLARLSHTDWELTDFRLDPPPTEPAITKPNATITISNPNPGTGRTITASTGVFLAGDVRRTVVAGSGVAVITGFDNATRVYADVLYGFDSSTYTSGNWRLVGSPGSNITVDSNKVGGLATVKANIDTFRTDDLNNYIYVNDGCLRITSYTDAKTVKARVLDKLNGIYKSDGTTLMSFSSWELEESEFSSTKGYPRIVGFYQQRLFLGSTNAKPHALWFSKTGDYANFKKGELDTDGISIALMSSDVQLLRWAVPARFLMVGSGSAEWRVGPSGSGEALTPTNLAATQESTYGSDDFSALRVDQSVLFVQRGGRNLRELAYSFESDAYVAPDLFRLARHLAEQCALSSQPTFVKSPEVLVAAPRADGALLTLTYTRAEGITAWSRWTTDGRFLAVAAIPGASGDELWAVVERTIGGNTKYYIERFAPFLQDTTDATSWRYVDSHLTYSGPPVTTLTGLNHLEGKTVQVWVNGAPHPDRTVSNGAISLERQATSAVVGLRYESRLQTVRVTDFQTAAMRGLRIRAFRIDLDVRHGYNLEVGVSFDRMDPILPADQLVSGIQANVLVPGGYEDEIRVCVRTSSNAPSCLLGYVLRYTVDEP